MVCIPNVGIGLLGAVEAGGGEATGAKPDGFDLILSSRKTIFGDVVGGEAGEDGILDCFGSGSATGGIDTGLVSESARLIGVVFPTAAVPAGGKFGCLGGGVDIFRSGEAGSSYLGPSGEVCPFREGFVLGSRFMASQLITELPGVGEIGEPLIAVLAGLLDRPFAIFTC